MADTMGDTKNYQVNRETPAADGGRDDVAIVYCTFPALDAAKAAGRMLVEQRLAACVNVFAAMTAIYEWEGAIHEDDEVAAIVKTTAGLTGDVFTAIKSVHPYANPALVAGDVQAGAPEYLAWVKAQCRRS